MYTSSAKKAIGIINQQIAYQNQQRKIASAEKQQQFCSSVSGEYQSLLNGMKLPYQCERADEETQEQFEYFESDWAIAMAERGHEPDKARYDQPKLDQCISKIPDAKRKARSKIERLSNKVSSECGIDARPLDRIARNQLSFYDTALSNYKSARNDVRSAIRSYNASFGRGGSSASTNSWAATAMAVLDSANSDLKRQLADQTAAMHRELERQERNRSSSRSSSNSMYKQGVQRSKEFKQQMDAVSLPKTSHASNNHPASKKVEMPKMDYSWLPKETKISTPTKSNKKVDTAKEKRIETAPPPSTRPKTNLSGCWRTYHSNGVKNEEFCVNSLGYVYGEYKRYFSNGKIVVRENYKKGCLRSSKRYRKNGSIESKVNYSFRTCPDNAISYRFTSQTLEKYDATGGSEGKTHYPENKILVQGQIKNMACWSNRNTDMIVNFLEPIRRGATDAFAPCKHWKRIR